MQRYIGFLRGINVGGHRKIKMDDLREMLKGMELQKVDTYIQSGNLVFDAGDEKSVQNLEQEIAGQIKHAFGHEVPVFLRRPGELAEIVNKIPFKEENGWKLYFSFLTDNPAEDAKKKLAQTTSKIEQYHHSGRTVYCLVDKSASTKPAFSNGFIEKITGRPATTRNYRTVLRMLKMAKS